MSQYPDFLGSLQQAGNIANDAKRGRLADLQYLQAKDDMEGRKNLKSLVPKAIEGDKQALTEISTIDPELFSSLDERQRSIALQRSQQVGSLLASVMQVPEGMRQMAYNQAAGIAVKQLGVNPDEIPPYDPQRLQMMVDQHREVENILGSKPKPSRTTVKPGDTVIDEAGNVVYKSEKPMTPEKEQPLVKDLRSRYDKFTTDLRDVDAAYRKVEGAPESAAGDMSLIFGYMKLLDPGSTVREGEFATAEQAAGVPTRILNAYNRVVSGERLSPEQRNDFKGTAKSAFDAQQASADAQIEDLLFQADADGIPRERVLGKKALMDFEKRQKARAERLPPEDKAAMEWAKSNPNDPRSKQILEMLRSK